METTLKRLRARREELEGKEGGFTLIELLIVIVILAILAAIVVFAVQNLAGTSAKASCNSDYKTVQTAVEAYKSQMGAYPLGYVDATHPAATEPVPTSTVSSSTQTDNDLTTANAALNITSTTSGTVTTTSGGELMTGSGDGTGKDYQSPAINTKNLVSPAGSTANDSVGPWLKTHPVNGNHYAIWVSNAGKGTLSVRTVDATTHEATATLVTNGTAADDGTCAAVS